MARPTMFASASGELYTRSLPNWRCSPQVTLKTPPLPFTCARCCSRLASATSSPKTRMRGSRAISSLRQVLRRSTMVVGSPLNWGSSSVSNCSDVGSTSGEYTYSSALSALGWGDASGDEAFRERLHAVAARVFIPLLGRAIQHFVVREGVRVRADDVRVHKER